MKRSKQTKFERFRAEVKAAVQADIEEDCRHAAEVQADLTRRIAAACAALKGGK